MKFFLLVQYRNARLTQCTKNNYKVKFSSKGVAIKNIINIVQITDNYEKNPYIYYYCYDGMYGITMYYDNEYNRANGDDL